MNHFAKSLALVIALALAGVGGYFAGVRSPRPPEAHEEAGTKQLWTCSMHPQVIQEKPGLCPICHMQLTPVAGPAGGASEPGIRIEPAVEQDMGVRTEVAALGQRDVTVRATGVLVEREPDISEVSLRVSGWLEHLYANVDGMEIKKGEPLFDLYSPELSLAIEELIAARKELEAAPAETAEALAASSRQRLARLGLADEQISAMSRLDHAPRIVSFTSPRSGHIRDAADLRVGAAVSSGQRILRIVDPSVLWVEMRVYERDLPLIRVGQRAETTIDGFPGKTFPGLVSFISPHLDEIARAAVIRINIANEESQLRQGMFAQVRIRVDPGPEQLLIPAEAVIETGERQVVMVSLGKGRYEAREVSAGVLDDTGRVAVSKGLAAGERVVVSGQFLLDSESRLREALRKYSTGPKTASATGPALTSAPEPPKPPAPAGLGAKVDAVFASYLAMSASLGKTQGADVPIDPSGLVMAATALRSAANTDADRSAAGAVLASAQALAGQNLAQQRERFKALGAAMLKLVDLRAPSSRVAPKLFHMHCPMAPGDWLQTNDTIANPFYADEMKECAEIVREIPTEGPR